MSLTVPVCQAQESNRALEVFVNNTYLAPRVSEGEGKQYTV